MEIARTTNFPANGAFDFSRIRDALDSNTNSDIPPVVDLTLAFGSRSTNQLRHDILIGAAGELFVGRLD